MQVVGLIFVTIIGTVVGLTCFQCNSHTDTACDDFFSGDSEAMREAFQVTCVPPSNATEEPLCRKTKIAIYHHNDSTLRVIRECGYGWRKSTHAHRDCYPVTQEDYDVQVCQCHGDNCNGALEKRVWAPLMLVSAAAASLLALCSA